MYDDTPPPIPQGQGLYGALASALGAYGDWWNKGGVSQYLPAPFNEPTYSSDPASIMQAWGMGLGTGSIGGAKGAPLPILDQAAQAAQGSKFGKGWWFNSKNGNLAELEPGSLGPNGDHDGWITVGDNAEKLGLTKDQTQQAKQFQDAMYGFMSDDGKTFYDPQDYKDNEAFKTVYTTAHPGVDPSIAQSNTDFADSLTRARLWPDGILSIVRHTGGDSIDQSELNAIKATYNKIQQAYPHIPSSVVIGNEEKIWRMSPQDFEEVKHLRDLESQQ